MTAYPSIPAITDWPTAPIIARAAAPTDSVELVRSHTTIDGRRVPVARFRKEIIRAGRFVQKAGPFEVTADRLRYWAATFDAMKSIGVVVPVTRAHPPTEKLRLSGGAVGEHPMDADPDSRWGRVDRMEVVDDRLVMECTLVGDQAIEAALRNDVSIYSPPEWADGYGTRYAWPITHVAITPSPCVPGLGEFIPIAAALALGLTNGGQTMEVTTFQKAVLTGLGIDPALATTPEAAEALILSAVGSRRDPNAPPSGGGSAAANPTPEPRQIPVTTPAATDPRAAAPAAAPAAAAQFSQLAPALQTQIGTMVGSARVQRIDALVKAGKITPDQASDFLARYVGDSASGFAPIAASLQGTADSFEDVMQALENMPGGFGKGSASGLQLAIAIPDYKKGAGDTPTGFNDPDAVGKVFDAMKKGNA